MICCLRRRLLPLWNFAITLTMTALMTRAEMGFPLRFAVGFVLAFVVGFPTSVLVVPFVRKIVDKLTVDQ